MPNPVGRPMKYRFLLEALEDNVIYSPATIVNYCLDTGVLDKTRPKAVLKLERTRIRHSLSRFSQNHGFPRGGDGPIDVSGQAMGVGWYGHRWKNALPAKHQPHLARKNRHPKRSKSTTRS